MASVFFSSDPANWDTFPHFKADLQMSTTTMTHPDPRRFIDQFLTEEIASKANKWSGHNPTRWSNEEYNRAYKAAESEIDPVKRAAMFIKMNNLLDPERRRDPGPVAGPCRRRLQQGPERRAEPIGVRLRNHANWYREA